MKLKKIASLALAGIMAVSMLAGCNGSTGGNNGGEEGGNEGQATGISTVVYENLSQAAKNNITLSDSAALNSALQQVVNDYVDNADVDAMYTNGFVKDTDSNLLTTPKTKLMDALDCGDWDVNFAPTTDGKAVTKVNMAYAGQGMSNTAILEEVASWIDTGIATAPTDGTGYTYTYTGSVSIVEKAAVNSNGVSRTVKIIAISVTQTPAEV